MFYFRARALSLFYYTSAHITCQYQKENLFLPFRYGAVSFAQKTNAWIVPSVVYGKYKFRSKDLWKLVSDKFTNRQTPHALKKLANQGKLEDLGGSPKKYRIKG